MSNKSLVIIIRELQERVAALEAKAKEVPAVTIITPVVLDAAPVEQKKPDRKMCPKCGVKPAYFFHVRGCRG